jgi:hypothetical protein
LSPLTKTFVVLLVIVSMLNAAAIVVFVNKAQPLQPQLTALNAQLQAAKLEATSNLNARQKSEDSYNAEVQQHQKDNSNNQAAVAAVQSQLNEAHVAIARLTADNTDLQAAMNTANNNVQISTKTSSTLQEQTVQLRTMNDKLVKDNEEFAKRNAQLTSTLESLTQKQEETQEQLAQNKENLEKLAATLRQKGYDPQAIIDQPVAGGGIGAPSIEGVVREKSIINGNTFVTISVGSADGVAKGMKFNVLDGSDFIGVVTIDTVDSDNSIGKLEGPQDKVGRVKNGDEVKTQLRS